MLGDPLVVQKYDRTTNVNFTKVSAGDGTAKFVSSADTATDKTTITIRYQRAKPRTLFTKGVPESIGQSTPSTVRRCNVKVTRELYNGTLGRWDVVTVNLTMQFESHIDVTTAANLKDIAAYAAFVPLTSATFTKLCNEEV